MSTQQKKSCARGKNFEKKTTNIFNNNELEAERISRLHDYGISLPDIILKDFPYMRLDCKKYAKFRHHTLYEEIETKYCKDKKDEAILISEEKYKNKVLVTIGMELFLKLLKAYK